MSALAPADRGICTLQVIEMPSKVATRAVATGALSGHGEKLQARDGRTGRGRSAPGDDDTQYHKMPKATPEGGPQLFRWGRGSH